MNIIVCVASTNPKHTIGFLEGIEIAARELLDPIHILVIENHEAQPSRRMFAELEREHWLVYRQGNPEKRSFAQVMKEKVKFVDEYEYADVDSIVWFADVDYFVHAQALRVMKIIFEENPRVNYLSLLRGPDVPDGNINLSGWLFIKWGSCMGGCTCARWSIFKKHAEGFFKKHGTNNFFDQLFWTFLWKEYGIGSSVYMMTWPFSLWTHCQLGSVYGHDKWPHGHMRAINFDPRADVFDLRIVK
jgi:hypothetical protein